MRLFLLTFIFIVFAFKFTFAQLAIINDPDGYVNVREGKSLKAKVIGKLFNGEVFLCDSENENDEWLWVAFDSENFKLFGLYRAKKFSDVENATRAFVYRSRVCYIKDLPNLKLSKKWTMGNNKLILNSDSINFIISKAPFVPKNHLIHISKAKCLNCRDFIDKVDGKTPIGEDGEMPTVEIKGIELSINGAVITIPVGSYDDLYQPQLNNLSLHNDKKGNIYILMEGNSDGAGSYDVVWVVNQGQLVARYFDGLD